MKPQGNLVKRESKIEFSGHGKNLKDILVIRSQALANCMGYIYLARSKSGKPYVGQTKHTPEKRWKQHVWEAYATPPKGCPRLNEAIRKYGADSFTLSTLFVCEDDQLDFWEETFIEMNDSVAFGYNVTNGGQNKSFNGAPETKQKLSESHRKNVFDEKKMPYGITLVEDGFRVRAGKKFLRIANSQLTMEEKYEIALKEREKILGGTFDETKSRRRVNEESKDLPRYVSYDPRRDGYYVRKPGRPVKSFTSKKISREEKLRLALEYVNS